MATFRTGAGDGSTLDRFGEGRTAMGDLTAVAQGDRDTDGPATPA